MRWYGHTARLERRVLPQKVLVERRQRKGYVGGLYVSRRVILKWILEELDVKQWTELPQNRIQQLQLRIFCNYL